MPYAKNLEDNVVPTAPTIVKAIKKAMGFKWLFSNYQLNLYIIFTLCIMLNIELISLKRIVHELIYIRLDILWAK